MYTNSKGIAKVAHTLILPCGFLIVTNAINCTIQVPPYLYTLNRQRDALDTGPNPLATTAYPLG